MADYKVFVVDMEGTLFAGSGDDDELSNAKVTKLSWEQNGPGAAQISLPTTDPDAGLLVPGREIQIWRDGQILFWGPIVRPDAGLDETTWQCAGLLWYFAHRFMGRADRQNQLLNGEFEDGEDNWDFDAGLTHSIDSTPPSGGPGGNALKLTGAAADHTDNASQTWTHPAGGYPTGDWITASTWVYVPSADYVNGARNDYGLVVAHRDADGNVLDAAVAEIGDDTPKDAWVPLEVLVTGVLEGHTVEVRLYPPHGVAYYDLATLTYMESLSFVPFPSGEVDVTDIIENIVKYAQDRPTISGTFDHGKSDLNIDTAGDDSGEGRRIAYQFAEHRNILDAILEYVRDGVCDISIEITATTRTFTIWPKNSDSRTPPLGKGVLYGTTLELDSNIASFSFAQDLENAASTVVLLGPGDGPDRPEGNAYDPTFVGGAFTLEIVEQAPDRTTTGQLDQRAQERLKIVSRPDILQVTTLPGSGVIGDLQVGDTVPIVISRGWVDIDDTYRVAHIEADLLTDQATITLNVVPA